jgi:hypothetical protein
MRQIAIIVIGSLIGIAFLIAVTVLVEPRCTTSSPSYSFGGWLIGGCPKNNTP